MTVWSVARALAAAVALVRAVVSVARPSGRGVGSFPSLRDGSRSAARFVTAVGLAWARRRAAVARAGSARVSPRSDDANVAALLDQASLAREAGRHADAEPLYRAVVDGRASGWMSRGGRAVRNAEAAIALRGLRDLAVAARRWREALDAEERLLRLLPPADRGREAEWLAALHYEVGREDLAAGRVETAIERLRRSLRADRHFVPAAVALGDAHQTAGDVREAVRVWERAADVTPSLALLGRLERVHRQAGRPRRMIALYQTAAGRFPDDLGLATALGRVYLELEMLDEAADQFEKIEVRAPDLPVVHAFLGASFERRGQAPEALEEYRRALRLAGTFSWPHRCASCGAETPTWEARCARCGHWNASRPADGR